MAKKFLKFFAAIFTVSLFAINTGQAQMPPVFGLMNASLKPVPTRTNLAAVTNNDTSSNLTTGSFTPANNSLLVVVVNGLTEDGAPTLSVSGGGLTYTSRVSITNESNVYTGWFSYAAIYTAPVSTGASMTVTLSDGRYSDGRALHVYQYTGFNTGTPVGATASGIRDDAQGSFSITLSGTPASNSEVIAAVTINNWDGTPNDNFSTGTSWTQLTSGGLFSSETQYHLQVRTMTSTTVLWNEVDAQKGLNPGDDPGGTASAVAIEIKAAP